MAVQHNATQPMQVYYQLETSNKSFLEMHYFLKSQGIQNNKFFLVLYDRDLAGINPRDPNLNETMKAKILRECMINYWYFIREVVRMPDQGGTLGGGKPYKLHRGNLAMNFGFILNWNMFEELPRQHGKSIGAIIWYLWVYNFGTTNSEIMFMNKKQDDSKLNLLRLKEIRAALPRYLRMNEIIKPDGTTTVKREAAESMANDYNNNKIKAMPGARNKATASSLGRGCTQPMQWYDEYAFILHNSIIYASATPAFSTASANAKRNGAPYGILITTTPGDLTTAEGEDAFNTKNNATPFNEAFYDYSMQQLEELKNTNTKSSFIYIRFTYKQLGSGEKYFKQMCIDLKNVWADIRREILLEWSVSSDNSPFTKQDLETVQALVREPVTQVCLGKYYFMDLYKPMAYESVNWPPIIGVDVSAGYDQDSTAITVVDSRTTEVVACLNCNYISLSDLTKVIYELVVKHMPNAIVNIERNGVGHGVLSNLVKTKIKRNLYYEYKDRVLEERSQGATIQKMTRKVKIYGFDNTNRSRTLLMDILRDRMENHKAKFISPIIYNELCTLEVKKNGRIEHADKHHDDQVFSYLIALYVWYEGEDLMERYGLQKGTVSTDDDITIEDGIENSYKNISQEMDYYDDDIINSVEPLLNSTVGSKSYNQWLEEQHMINEMATQELRKNPRTKAAYYAHTHLDPDEGEGANWVTLPSSVFDDFNGVENQQQNNELMDIFNNL